MGLGWEGMGQGERERAGVQEQGRWWVGGIVQKGGEELLFGWRGKRWDKESFFRYLACGAQDEGREVIMFYILVGSVSPVHLYLALFLPPICNFGDAAHGYRLHQSFYHSLPLSPDLCIGDICKGFPRIPTDNG